MNYLLLSSEEVDFNIHVIKTLRIFGLEFRFTDSLWYACWIAVFLIIAAVILNRKLRRVDPMAKPKGVQNVLEYAVSALDNFTVGTMGPVGHKFSAFYGSMFIYILLCNLSGLFVWFRISPAESKVWIEFMRPPTADLAVTLSLALITFFMTQGFGLKAKGLKGWLKGFTEPVTLLTPINIIGEVANPISLSFRLMGNVLAGTIIMALYYGMLPMLAYIISPALHFYFDVFAGVLQSFIFVMLSMIYVSGAME